MVCAMRPYKSAEASQNLQQDVTFGKLLMRNGSYLLERNCAGRLHVAQALHACERMGQTQWLHASCHLFNRPLGVGFSQGPVHTCSNAASTKLSPYATNLSPNETDLLPSAPTCHRCSVPVEGGTFCLSSACFA